MPRSKILKDLLWGFMILEFVNLCISLKLGNTWPLFLYTSSYSLVFFSSETSLKGSWVSIHLKKTLSLFFRLDHLYWSFFQFIVSFFISIQWFLKLNIFKFSISLWFFITFTSPLRCSVFLLWSYFTLNPCYKLH